MSELYDKESPEHIIIVPTENTCVMCGEIIPEGRMVCFQCTQSVNLGESAFPWDIIYTDKSEHTKRKRCCWKTS